MKNRLIKVMDKFSHDMSISELQQLYKNREDSELSYHDTLYLNIIAAHPNKYTSSQIADLLKITRPAVTQKINELAKKGYIIRQQSEKDKRVYYLSANPKKSYYGEDYALIELKVINILIEKYGEERVAEMCDMLEHLSDLLYDERMKVL